VCVSFDAGGVWQPFSLDLPATPVHGIRVKNDDLVIGTHGRSFYVMDNINVLRQIERRTTDEALVLFKPGDAMRNVSRGVAIDYFLKQPADTVTIEILDAQGTSIKTFTGKPATTAPAAAAAAPPQEDGPPRQAPARVPVQQGLNRFVWDTRYPDATTFPGLIMWAGSVRGPMAPPGQYQVRLTAAGGPGAPHTKTQSFSIVRSPRIAATDADLQAQFTLARQINARVGAANDTVIRIRSLKDQIADRSAKANDAKIKAAGEALAARLTDVEGQIYQYRNRSSQDPLNFPIRLNNKLAALQGIVEAGDNRPTDQSHAVFKELSDRLDAQLARLEALIKTDLAAFNTQTKRKKLAPVVVK
jgi:hypothetical protein